MVLKTKGKQFHRMWKISFIGLACVVDSISLGLRVDSRKSYIFVNAHIHLYQSIESIRMQSWQPTSLFLAFTSFLICMFVWMSAGRWGVYISVPCMELILNGIERAIFSEWGFIFATIFRLLIFDPNEFFTLRSRIIYPIPIRTDTNSYLVYCLHFGGVPKNFICNVCRDTMCDSQNRDADWKRGHIQHWTDVQKERE